ncbi:protein crowded nuclei 4 [Tanacetum coccineum]
MTSPRSTPTNNRVSYVAKLETQISSLQNLIGILISEKKEWVAKYEQMRSTANTFELALKRDYAAHVAALAEAKKSEEGLKKALRIEKERLLDGQALLTTRTTEISLLEEELQASRLKLEEEYEILKEEKYMFDLKKVSLDARDEDINRKENESKKKYQELQIEQEKIASKESNRINQALADNEAALKERNSQFEAELETKVKLTDEKIDNKRRASELIDEKRDELRLEAERIAEERVTISKFLKDERDFMKLEKDLFRDQYKKDVESLSRDREIFMKEIEQERSEWFSKIQKERTDILLDTELQKKELENRIEMKREEIESYLKEKEKAFEDEKKKELQYISSLKEIATKEAEQVNIEMQRLDEERKAIIIYR